jgi:hypothetical protein
MSNELKFEEARAAMKDLARKVETIDLSGKGLVGGKKKARKAKKAKSPSKKSASPRKTNRSSASKSKSRSKGRKASAGSKKTKRASSGTKKTAMSINEHKLADNLIQLGVQLKNMQLDGGKKRKARKSSAKKSKGSAVRLH